MEIHLNCSQTESLINLYIENKLEPQLKKAIEAHIKKCPKCKKKINQLQNILLENYNRNQNIINSQSDKKLIKNLSAYIDNELDATENIKIKKITISNQSARKKLESMYNYQKLMHLAFEKTKNNSKFDYSKNVISSINEAYSYNTTYFKNITIIFFIIITAIICGFIYLYLQF